jgi:hypothetical protein
LGGSSRGGAASQASPTAPPIALAYTGRIGGGKASGRRVAAASSAAMRSRPLALVDAAAIAAAPIRLRERLRR